MENYSQDETLIPFLLYPSLGLVCTSSSGGFPLWQQAQVHRASAESTHTQILECKSLHLVTDELYISLPASWCLRGCWTQSGWQIHVCPSHSFPCPVNKSHSLRTLPIKGLIVRPIKHLIVFHFHGQFHVMLDESIQTPGAAVAGSSNQAFEDVLCVL